MQMQHQTSRAEAPQSDALTLRGADRHRANPCAETPARIAAAEDHRAADGAVDEAPALAESTPLLALLAPLEGVEEHPAQGNEQSPAVIIGRHGKPVKKRDLRKRPHRKRPPYQPTGRKLGDHSFQPTSEQRRLVSVLTGMLVKQKTIASLIGEKGIDEKTLVKHFKHELETGREHFVASLKGMVVKSAQNGSVRAQTYLLDRLGGPEFAPRMRLGADEMAPIEVNSAAKVTIFLPDNGRRAND